MEGEATDGEGGRRKADGAHKEAFKGKEKENTEGKESGANEAGAVALPAHASAARSAGGGGGGGEEVAAGDCAASLGEALALSRFNLSASPPPPAAEAGGAGAAGGERGRVPQGKGVRVRRFTYDALSAATDKFSKRLGTGGFGSVFDGTLVSGTRIAVKKLVDAGAAETSQREQMATEVEVLTHVQHANIVPLLGWSEEGAAPCLVYALMEGGSLQDRLACGDKTVPLASTERITVLSDVARGLAYLHAEVKVIHRDVKSANVLIDRGCSIAQVYKRTFETVYARSRCARCRAARNGQPLPAVPDSPRLSVAHQMRGAHRRLRHRQVPQRRRRRRHDGDARAHAARGWHAR